MSDLKDFKAAIDGIEVTEQQKRKMYSNIIEKAETKRKKFSLPSLALKLAPAVSFCLIAVIAGSLLLNQSMNFGGGQKEADYQKPASDEIQPTDIGPVANASETSEEVEVDGIVYTVTVRELKAYTATNESDSSPTNLGNTCLYAISWTEDGMLYTISSDQVADEESLLKVRDKVMELFNLKD